MNQSTDPHAITTIDQLQALNGPIAEASIKKEVPFVHPVYRAIIEASPFAVLSTSGPGGLDASPRGDLPGFVQVLDEHTLLLPERRGNNRTDSLRNFLADPRVGLLFFVPGMTETLRAGRATISVNLLARFTMEGKPPKCIVVIRVETVFFQCARAIYRSRQWERAADGIRPDVPTPGAILQALTDSAFDGETYDRDLPGRQQATLY
jgi:hypothetical protein